MTKPIIDDSRQEALWEQVADGELAPERLADLVTLCDERPELWRRCALLLLEEQAFTQSLRAYAKDMPVDAQAPDAQAPIEVVGHSLASPAKLVIPTSRQTLLSAPAAPQAQLRAMWINNVALAAAVMLAFLVGWQAARRWNGGSSELVAGTTVPHSNAADLAALPSQSAQGDGKQLPSEQATLSPQDGNLFVSTTNGLDAELIDEVNAESLATAIGVERDPELARKTKELRRRGFDVDAQEGLMQFWLYDGSAAVVPYHQIKVRPKQSSQAY